ncbi:polysaccharide deacetylase family protein [Halovenus halobia]|uniref:polysaccharide deacetylase family protein n=1 Tax=Halovenus halobia TaxID=3396622 RepID=UPI003F57E4B4
MITLTLSLDTELAWGRTGDRNATRLAADESAGRDAIKRILSVFDEYDIPATWGIVGHLLLTECDRSRHYTAPYIDEIDPYSNRASDPLYYGPEILDWIEDAATNHEVAGHSFTHPQFGELDRSAAHSELDAMVGTFEDAGVDIDSLIHPRIDLAHLDLLPEYGIKCYSGSSETTNYTIKQGVPKLLRWDSELVGAPTVEAARDEYGTLCVPRSRSLRDERWGWLNPYRVRRTINNANDGILHLTFHPHNFIYDRFLRWTLERVANIIATARSKDKLEIKTFREIECAEP